MMPAARYETLERFAVKDPKGTTHFIERDYHGYSKTENLAWFIEESNRVFATAAVLDKITASPEMGEYAGWVWLRL
jgi:hypothetical protein